jgi:hypothetical protein
MILIVSKNCGFCGEFKDTPDLVIAVLSEDAKTMDVFGHTMATPWKIDRVPMLVDGTAFYVGRDVIRKRINPQLDIAVVDGFEGDPVPA